ncbi:MAG: PorP/SprF family type IX secretion system membrane protein, partial [Crocinitomicaceae bacterium]|nr:PorP/SprF family type IX secretion system membrane protein [Crocinitomicaceae bacterium]
MKLSPKIIALFLLFTTPAIGQQDPMISQYMFNGLYLNPAYAGSHEYWSSTLNYRTQWAGADFNGAPETTIAAVDGPIHGKNMGLGAMFLHDRIGVTRQNTFVASYAYQLKMRNKSKLAMGLNAGVAQYNSNVEEVLIWDEEDRVYAKNTSVILPRVGLGLYYFSKRYYAGVSIPTLLAYED